MSTVDVNELQHFKQFTAEWWQETGYLKALHSMNKLRVPFIRDGIINSGCIQKEQINRSLPLQEISILEVGCGGKKHVEIIANMKKKYEQCFY